MLRETNHPAKSKLIALSFFIFGLICLVVAFNNLSTSQAQGPRPDNACINCHVGKTEDLILPSGETLPLGVDLNILGDSVHGGHTKDLLCTDCHQNGDNYLYPHQPNPAQTRQDFSEMVSQTCRNCHEPLEKHNPGHILATASNPNLPTCVNCHPGGHAISSADPLAADPVGTCQNCHSDFEDAEVSALHEQVTPNLTGDNTCQTCHADEPLFPIENQCIICHNLLDEELILESGDTIPLHVETNDILDSVHGTALTDKYGYTPLGCTDCHSDIVAYTFPHEPEIPADKREYLIEKSNLCVDCHQDIGDKHNDSTHALALAEGNTDAATCIDCHGSHQVQPPAEPRAHISETCAQCHGEINEVYAESIHGAALLGEDNHDVPVCTDCHGVHDIADPTTALFRVRSPRLCADCHADEALMEKYDISTDVFNSYVADFHGTTVNLFEEQSPDHETNKAVCYDCHGVHDIRAATDENSHIIKENLLETCRQCHPDATANFPDSWASHFEPSPQHNPMIYFVNLFYDVMIPLVIGGFLVFISSDVYRRIRHKWLTNKGNS